MLPSSCSRTVPVLSSLVADDRRGRVMPGNSKPLMRRCGPVAGGVEDSVNGHAIARCRLPLSLPVRVPTRFRVGFVRLFGSVSCNTISWLFSRAMLSRLVCVDAAGLCLFDKGHSGTQVTVTCGVARLGDNQQCGAVITNLKQRNETRWYGVLRTVWKFRIVRYLQSRPGFNLEPRHPMLPHIRLWRCMALVRHHGSSRRWL